MRIQHSSATDNDPKALRPSFTLRPEDLPVINAVRSDTRRLARALLLVWARAERVIAPDPARLPLPLIAFVAAQLGLNPEVLDRYKNWPAIHTADAEAVQNYLQLRPFTVEDAQQLRVFLAARVAQTGNSSELLVVADDWLARQGLLRPRGRTTIERLVYQVRSEAEKALFADIAGQLSPAQREQLDALCQSSRGESMLSVLAAPSHQPSASAIRDDCHRLALVQAITADQIDWGPVTPNRRAQWAAIVKRLTAQALRRYPAEKRATLLLAFLAVRGEEITDTIIDMFDMLIDRVFARSANDLIETRVEQVQSQLASVRFFRRITQVLLDPEVADTMVRQEVFQRVPRERVSALVEQSQSLDQSEVELFFALLKGRFTQVREFAPVVLETLHFGALCSGQPVMKGMETLRTINKERRKKVPRDAPLGFVPQHWLSAVARPDEIDRRAWELCLLLEIRLALRAGELTVEGSRRYAPWEGSLYAPAAWDGRRVSWFAERGLPQDGATYLAQAKAELHRLTVEVANHWAEKENPAAHIQKDRLVLSVPERVQVPPAVEQARRALVALLPRVSLAELLMEVDHWTNFTSAFTHLAERQKPGEDQVTHLRPALFAVLVAQATNLGLPTMAVASGIQQSQLARVYTWYMREETLRPAINMLIQYQRSLPLAAAFGPGTTSLAHTLQLDFIPPGAYAPRAPPVELGRGIRLSSNLSDQGAQLWLGVISSLADESSYLLDGLLAQQPPIREHYADTAGSSANLLFGLSDLLGYHFAPRLRGLLDEPLMCVEDEAAYGALGPLLRHSLNEPLLVSQWDEMNRLAASLKDQLVPPSLIIARFQGMRQPHPLQQAIQEVGRLARTRHILSYIDDAVLRRRILLALSKGERLQALARALFFGQQGRISDRSYETQVSQALALSLIINAVVVWNTHYLELAATSLAHRGQPVSESLWADLSPILWEHLHLIGKFPFDGPLIGAERGAWQKRS